MGMKTKSLILYSEYTLSGCKSGQILHIDVLKILGIKELWESFSCVLTETKLLTEHWPHSSFPAYRRDPASGRPPLHGQRRHVRPLRQGLCPPWQEEEVWHKGSQENAQPRLQRDFHFQGELRTRANGHSFIDDLPKHRRRVAVWLSPFNVQSLSFAFFFDFSGWALASLLKAPEFDSHSGLFSLHILSPQWLSASGTVLWLGGRGFTTWLWHTRDFKNGFRWLPACHSIFLWDATISGT